MTIAELRSYWRNAARTLLFRGEFREALEAWHWSLALIPPMHWKNGTLLVRDGQGNPVPLEVA